MTIFCRVCRQAVTAPNQKEIMGAMTHHLQTHPEKAAELAKTIVETTQLAATYLMVRRYVDIPKGEKELLKTFDEAEKALIGVFALLEPEAH